MKEVVFTRPRPKMLPAAKGRHLLLVSAGWQELAAALQASSKRAFVFMSVRRDFFLACTAVKLLGCTSGKVFVVSHARTLFIFTSDESFISVRM